MSDAADLLRTARSALLEKIVPDLAGPARFEALMAANAIAIALRSTPAALATLAAADEALGDAGLLVARIRAGGLDPGAPDHAAIRLALLACAEARCAISAPKALGA